MASGRPTKLTPAVVAKARKFVEERSKERTLLPTVEGLALEIGISRETVYAWAEPYEQPANSAAKDLAPGVEVTLRGQFSDIVSDLKNAQAEKLVQNGLNGRYNATIAKLILSGKHGYVEKSELDQNISGNVSFVNDVPRPKEGDA